MPKYRVETNAGTYEIEADREPTANDVESYLRQSKTMEQPVATETVAAEVATPQGEVVASETVAESAPTEAPKSIGDDLQASGWNSLSRTERYNLFIRNLPKYAAQSLLGIGSKAEGIAERTIPTVVGQNLGRASGLPLGERIGGGVGAMVGETIAQTREQGTEFRPGAILGAGVSGAVTGKPLAGAGRREVMREGAKYAAGNLASTVTETAVDEGRAPSLVEAGVSAASGLVGAQMAKALARTKIEGARAPIHELETKTLKDLQGEGFVVPPHKIDGGKAIPTALAGAEVVERAAAAKNQFAVQRLAREDIGLSKEAVPIRVSELEARRAALAAPYEEIKAFQEPAADELKKKLSDIAAKYSDPHEAAAALDEPATKAAVERLRTLAAADVDELKIVRDSAKSARKAFENGDPAAYDVWQAQKARAESIEAAIEKAANEVGDKTLVDRLKASRKQIAQTYSVEEALNQGNGMVDPLALGRKLQAGDILTGNLEKIAKFQLAFRREAVEMSRLSGADVSTLLKRMNNGNISVLGGAVRAVQGAVGGPAKTFLLSDFVQGGLTNPREVQNFSSAMARYISENAASEAMRAAP